jgi:GNAT superfamily N-acetyltransferase
MTSDLTTLSPRPLTVADQAAVDGWLALLAASGAGSPGGPPPCPVDMVGSLRHPPPGLSSDDWVVWQGSRVVAALRLLVPGDGPAVRLDQLLVHPEARRAGIGRMLYEHALARVAAHGRDMLAATVVEPLPGSTAVDTGPAAFAGAVGAQRAADPAGLHQWLDLAERNPLAAGVPAPPAGYALASWGTITPDEYAVAVSTLELTLGTGPLETAGQDVAGCYARQFETVRTGRGRRAYHTGAVHEATGQLVAYTSISKTTCNPAHALQGMTVVHVRHRGHGLGLVLKLANLDQARRHEPALRMVETANDETNEAMLAVNSATGFRPHDRWVTWTARR